MNTPKDNTPLQTSPAAWIGLDWGDKEHAFAIQDTTGKSEEGTLPHSAENLHKWLQGLGARPVALAIEASRGAVIHALLEYPWLRIYPINPITSARYRSAFAPSGAKDDLPDAKVLLELVRDHAAKLRVLEPQDPATVKLAGLVEARRKLVDRRTQLILQVQSLLKTYYPQALEVAGDLKSDVAVAFLNRWPDLISLKAARPATIKRFFHQHQVRSQDLIEQRLALIAKAKALTTDDARVGVAVLHLRALLDQLKVFHKHIPHLDDAIKQAFAEHADRDLFVNLPGAGRQLAPRLCVAFGTLRSLYPDPASLQKYAGDGRPPRSCDKPSSNGPVKPCTTRSGPKSITNA
jgi:transposase